MNKGNTFEKKRAKIKFFTGVHTDVIIGSDFLHIKQQMVSPFCYYFKGFNGFLRWLLIIKKMI
jgi:hypothetical protein